MTTFSHSAVFGNRTFLRFTQYLSGIICISSSHVHHDCETGYNNVVGSESLCEIESLYFYKSIIVMGRSRGRSRSRGGSSGGFSSGGIAYIVGLAHEIRLKETKF